MRWKIVNNFKGIPFEPTDLPVLNKSLYQLFYMGLQEI